MDKNRAVLEQALKYAEVSGRYNLRNYIRKFQNVCLYGLGKLFADTYFDRKLQEHLHVNYVCDKDASRYRSYFGNGEGHSLSES